MLGMWTAATGILRPEAMRLSLGESVPPKTRDINLEAFDIGYREGRKIGERKAPRGPGRGGRPENG
jgi:Pyruvate/2-oxoacid:ferredoxin oxidoreductase gamma subunit